MRLHCDTCTSRACLTGSGTCPLGITTETLGNWKTQYAETATCHFARQALLVHNAAALHLPEGGVIPRNPRIEEIVQFARRMNYTNIGIAFCAALQPEAAITGAILRKRGFTTHAVSCSVGGLVAETVRVCGNEKLGGPDARQVMCNPIAQAELLNSADVDLNVVVGLCVGHDSLFFSHAQAPTTVLLVKDRVFGHNPIAALHESERFYRWLQRSDGDAVEE